MVGGAGVSAFPMSARVIQKMALEERTQKSPADARGWRQCGQTDPVPCWREALFFLWPAPLACCKEV